MAIIPQPHLFGWEDMQGLGDLERLQCVLEVLPDEPLMAMLEHDRGRGRNAYPVRGMWNATLAGTVFQHPSVETLRRDQFADRILPDFPLSTRVGLGVSGKRHTSQNSAINLLQKESGAEKIEYETLS